MVDTYFEKYLLLDSDQFELHLMFSSVTDNAPACALDEGHDRLFHQERAELRSLAHIVLNRAFDDDEPDYSDVPAYSTRRHY